MPYQDGYLLATSISTADIINIAQGGTPGIPGTATTRSATLSQILGGAPGFQYLPLIGGTITGSLIVLGTVTLQGVLIVPNLPTSSFGLATGQLWNNGGFVCVA